LGVRERVSEKKMGLGLGLKGTTIAHNFHLLFGYTFGHIM